MEQKSGAPIPSDGPAADASTSGSVRVRVRFFAGAAAAAGTSEEELSLDEPATVTDLVSALVEQHGSVLARVLPACTFLLDGVSGGRDRTLGDGCLLDVLPPFTGG